MSLYRVRVGTEFVSSPTNTRTTAPALAATWREVELMDAERFAASVGGTVERCQSPKPEAPGDLVSRVKHLTMTFDVSKMSRVDIDLLWSALVAQIEGFDVEPPVKVTLS